VGAVVLVLALVTCPAVAETLKVTTFLPPTHTFVRALKEWGRVLTEESDGELILDVFPAGQLGPPQRQFDLVRYGVADIGIIMHGSTPGRFPKTELAGLPLTHPSQGDASAIASRRLTELAPAYLAAEHAGTHILWLAVTPPVKIHLAETRPDELGNLAGLRIRYAGTTLQKVIEALGASPVPVPPAETGDAMRKGVVDGATFPFEGAMAFDLGPVTKYSIEPGIAPATFAVVMRADTYNRLSPPQRAIIDRISGPERAAWFGSMWDEVETRGRDYMVDAGVTIVHLSDSQIAELRGAFVAIADRSIAEAGGDAAEFIRAYTR